MRIRLMCGAACAAAFISIAARADIALSSNDGHTILADGVQIAPPSPLPDTLSVIDLAHLPPKIIATIDVPGSVVGPPMAVAIAPDESYAIVTSATKADPKGPAGISPDDRVTVVDLKARPPAVAQTLTAGLGATVVRISPDGKLALVANRGEGTVSIFAIHDRRLEPAGKLDLGNPKAGPSGLAFLRDGHTALVSRDGDSMVSVLHIDGTTITIDPRPITTGLRPYTLDVNAAGTLAAVSNMGRGDGDIDTVSLIDLTKTPIRTIETIGVGRGPEGLKFSPDGKLLAVGLQDGSTKPKASPFHTDTGRLVMFRVETGTIRGGEVQAAHLQRLAETPIGGWSQGIAFSRDGRYVLVQNMVQTNIQMFRWADDRLVPAGALDTHIGPAAIRTPWP